MSVTDIDFVEIGGGRVLHASKEFIIPSLSSGYIWSNSIVGFTRSAVFTT